MKYGVDQGTCLALFERTVKKVLMHKKIMELVQDEIKRAKNLVGKSAP